MSVSDESVKKIPEINRKNDAKLLLIEGWEKISNDTKCKSKKIRNYNKKILKFTDLLRQNNVVTFKKVDIDPHSDLDDALIEDTRASVAESGLTPREIAKDTNRKAFIAVRVSLALNFVLLIGKIAACIPSNSISIISSTLDSAVDIFSSAVSWYTNYSIKNINIYKHPQGKTKLEPLGIILISCVMSVTSFQVMTEGLKRIITRENLVPEFSYYSLGIITATVVIKSGLFIYCHSIKSPSAQVLAQDNRNDVISNIVVLIGFVFSKYVWGYFDSIGAILISLYIFINWFITGKSLIGSLIGKTAPPEIYQMITWIAIYHDDLIKSVDTVRVFSFGTRYLVEVDIILPPDMMLKEAHDIGERLQTKLEALESVERAYVHLDYESFHNPHTEHKIGVLF